MKCGATDGWRAINDARWRMMGGAAAACMREKRGHSFFNEALLATRPKLIQDFASLLFFLSLVRCSDVDA